MRALLLVVLLAAGLASAQIGGPIIGAGRSNYNPASVAITGGTITGVTMTNSVIQTTTIGGTALTNSSGAFTTLSANINQNAATAIQVNNLTVGSGAIARYMAITDSATVEFGSLSSGFTPNGVFIPNVAYLYGPASAGIALAAPSGPITFASGGTTSVGSITSTGLNGMVIGATTPAVASFTALSGKTVTTGTVPTIGACGTSPAVAGTDNAMLVTVGTGGVATSCAVNFSAAWTTNAPVCVAQSNTDIVATRITVSTTVVTVTATAPFTASSQLNILCTGRI